MNALDTSFVIDYWQGEEYAKAFFEGLGETEPVWSAKLVFMVLEHEGTLTQKRLIEETRLSARTVRYALRRLEDINAVSGQTSFMDARQTLYTTTHASASVGTA